MPTWESTSPYEPQPRGRFRWNAATVLVAVHVAGLFLLGILEYTFLLPVTEYLGLHALNAVKRLFLWQFLTYPLLNDIGPIGLLWFTFFMVILYQWGREVERMFGARRLLIVFLAGQCYGGLVQCVYQFVATAAPATGIFYPGLFAVAMYLSLASPHGKVLFMFVIPMRRMTCVLLLLGLQVFYCLTYFRMGMAPFASAAAVLTATLMFKLDPRIDRWLDRREAFQSMRRSVERVEAQRRVDKLLEKISAKGMGSLTAAERRFLERASRGGRG